jgi:hypothetical protein
VISRRKETYLGNSKLLPVGYVPGVSPAPDFGGGRTDGTEGGVDTGGADAGDDDGVGPAGVSASRE